MITMFSKQLVLANKADVNSKQIQELLTAGPLSVLKAVGDGVMVSDSPLTELEHDYITPSYSLRFSLFISLFLALVNDDVRLVIV